MTEATGTHPPTTTAPPPATTDAVPRGPRAGFWIRFGAAILDGLILWVPYLIIATVIDPVVGYLVYLVGSIAYFTILEGGETGQTLGKKVCGIRVVDHHAGGPIGNGRAFVRWISRILSSIPLALGYLWMLWDGEKQTWHDKLSSSIVVPEQQYPIQRA